MFAQIPTKKASVLVTECDTLPGFYVARQIINSGEWKEVVCAVTDERNELAQMLRKEGGNLVNWDWTNEHTMQEVLVECDALVFQPPREYQAVEYVENMLQALKKAKSPIVYSRPGSQPHGKGIKAMVLMSCILAEFAQSKSRRGGETEFPQLWLEIEELVHEQCAGVPILRTGVPMQAFFYLSEIIQNRGIIPLSAGNGEFAPVDFKDVSLAANNILIDLYKHMVGGGSLTSFCYEGMYASSCNNYYGNCSGKANSCFIADACMGGDYCYDSFATKQPSRGGRHPRHGKIYTLTGTHLVTGQQLAKLASEALNAKIKYESINESEMKKILQKNSEMSKFDVAEFTTVLQYIKQGELDIVTRELQKLIKKTPETVKGFFSKNAASFAPKY